MVLMGEIKMSLDLYIGDENLNCTYNVSKMWYDAFPDDEGMVYIDGMTGKQAYDKVQQGLTYALKHKKQLIKYEPENGWGSWESYCNFLFKILIACVNNPNKKWRSWR